jgi:two-component system, NtrC family, response regulator GlrR
LAALLRRRYNPIALQEVRLASILVVDDEPHVVTLEAAFLEAAGHAPTIAMSTKEGINRIHSNRCDLVITGWRNGDASGWGVIAAAKEKNIPVVVASGSGFAEALQADPPRADLYLEKPMNVEALVTAVDKLLSQPTK